MALVLRIIGAVWILLTARVAIGTIRGLFDKGIQLNIGVTQLLSLIMLAGGIGLLLLKEWGRWILLLGAIAFLLLLTGPSLIQFKLGPIFFRNLVFYGIFIALLVLPQAKAATRG